MSVFLFKTIKKPSQGSFRDKGSKFLAFAYPVVSDEEIKDRLAFLKREYHDARHQGFAWILGPDQNSWRAFDDGEPKHSTGDPILGQIRSRQLTNILVVVVRYFGGTKLGISGLIAAYRAAAAEALDKAIIVEEEVISPMTLVFDFASTPEVMRLVKEFDLAVLKQEHCEETKLELGVPLRLAERIRDRLALLMAKGSRIRVEQQEGSK